jgi:hypothetical protein
MPSTVGFDGLLPDLMRRGSTTLVTWIRYDSGVPHVHFATNAGGAWHARYFSAEVGYDTLEYQRSAMLLNVAGHTVIAWTNYGTDKRLRPHVAEFTSSWSELTLADTTSAADGSAVVGLGSYTGKLKLVVDELTGTGSWTGTRHQ